MQNELDDGKIAYHESTDSSGFIVRELPNTNNTRLRFQAGRHVKRPILLPIYDKQGTKIIHHREGDDIEVFRMDGYGRSKEEALSNAANNLLRADVEKQRAMKPKLIPLTVCP